MINITSESNKEKIKIGIMVILLLISIFLIYYFRFILHTHIIYTHFFYIPIVLACMWWKWRGISVAILLGGMVFFTQFFHEYHAIDIVRSIMFIVVAILITELGRERAHAEEGTKRALDEIDKIFQTTGDGLRVIDKNFNVIKYNDAFLTLSGESNEQIMGKKCFTVFPGPLCNTPDCTLRQFLNGKERVECDIEKKRADGTRIFCILTATPLRGSNGELVGIIEDFKDITDRKVAEETLNESEEKHRSFVKNIKGIAIAYLPDGDQNDSSRSPIFIHGAIETITGYKEEELSAGNIQWNQIIYKDDLPKIYQTSKKLCRISEFKSACEPYEREYRIVRKDGQVRWVRETLQTICAESGKPASIQGILFDITEKKQTEEALYKTEEKLLQAQKMEAVGRLAGGIAHDFNNLLTVIIGNTEDLMNDLDKDNPVRSNIEEIYKAGESASLLISRLLAFGRRQVLNPKALDLNMMVTDTEKLLRHVIGEDIEIITVLESGLLQVKADPSQIEQVIMNLAVNARDAMPKGGALTIRTEEVLVDNDYCKMNTDARPGRFIRLLVEDTGVGMDKNTLSQIFEPFFTTKAPGEGTGLGLSTVYGIVKQHFGWITVYSEPGHGSTFEIYLPAVSTQPLVKLEEDVELQKVQGSGERILIVEDDERVRRFTKRVLEKNGYRVFESGAALDALSLFEKEGGKFHLVLIDVVLPDINGVELANRLIGKDPDLPVLLCSGYSYLRSQWSIAREDNFQFIKKPYNLNNLLQVIKGIINAHKKEGV